MSEEQKTSEGQKLGAVADVIVGQIMTRVTSKDGVGESVPVLMPKAIAAGNIITEYLGEAVLAKAAGSEKYTRKGDVVFKLAAPFGAAYVEEDKEGLLIPSFCAVIRITKDNEMDAKYLTACLNCGYEMNLYAVMAGSSRPMIKVWDIRNLKIPKVSARDMKDIGEAYMLSRRKKAILIDMAKAEENLMKSIVLKSIMEGAGNE